VNLYLTAIIGIILGLLTLPGCGGAEGLDCEAETMAAAKACPPLDNDTRADFIPMRCVEARAALETCELEAEPAPMACDECETDAECDALCPGVDP
jgi:hypothetical protein